MVFVDRNKRLNSEVLFYIFPCEKKVSDWKKVRIKDCKIWCRAIYYTSSNARQWGKRKGKENDFAKSWYCNATYTILGGGGIDNL